MVEAVVAVPFFIIIFASMTFVVELYAQKQRTLRQAKEYAWVHAMGNCTGSTPNTTNETETDPMGELSSTDPNVDPNAADPYESSTAGTSKLTQDWGTAKATVTGHVAASYLIGGFENDLNTTTRVQCNEEPIEGDLWGVFKFAWNMLKGQW